MHSIQHRNDIGRSVKAVLCAFALFFACFGVLTIQYAIAVMGQDIPWLISLIDSVAHYQSGAEPGLKTIEESLSSYHQYMGSMATHAMVGGFVVMAGVLQFIPVIRRNHRQFHRINGVLMGLFMTAVSVTGLYFLYHMPLNGILAGASFYFALTAVALLSLGLLTQAALAISARDFRAHMVWMSLAFACFLTAPLLRLNYIAVAGLDEQFFNRVVQNSSPTILLQALVLMMLWYAWIGDKDLPTRTRSSMFTLPKNLPEWMSFGAIAGVLITSVAIVFQNLDDYFVLGHGWGVACVLSVALVKTCQAWMGKQTWTRGIEGLSPTRQNIALTLAGCASWGLLAYSMNTELFYAQALFYTAIHLAIIELLIALIAFRTRALSTGRALFTLISACMSWFWTGIPAVAGLFLAFHFKLDMALTTALGLVPSVFLIFATLVASGVPLRWSLRSK